VICAGHVRVDGTGDTGTVTKLGTVFGSVGLGAHLGLGRTAINGATGSSDAGIDGLVSRRGGW